MTDRGRTWVRHWCSTELLQKPLPHAGGQYSPATHTHRQTPQPAVSKAHGAEKEHLTEDRVKPGYGPNGSCMKMPSGHACRPQQPQSQEGTTIMVPRAWLEARTHEGLLVVAQGARPHEVELRHSVLDRALARLRHSTSQSACSGKWEAKQVSIAPEWSR